MSRCAKIGRQGGTGNHDQSGPVAGVTEADGHREGCWSDLRGSVPLPQKFVETGPPRRGWCGMPPEEVMWDAAAHTPGPDPRSSAPCSSTEGGGTGVLSRGRICARIKAATATASETGSVVNSSETSLRRLPRRFGSGGIAGNCARVAKAMSPRLASIFSVSG